MGFGDNFKKGLAELQERDDGSNASPRSGIEKRQHNMAYIHASGYDEYDPPEAEMHEYWQAFQSNPYIRRAITSFAREVVEPGWWIEAENQNQAEKLAKWLRNCCIVEGEKGQDFALLLKQAIIQREVRGTCLVEHVPDANDRDKLAGMKLINPETVTTFTKDGSSVLLDPDDDVPDNLPATEDGKAPAYIQFWEARYRRDPVPFARDQITKMVRDNDIGDPYGTSILQSVLDRVQSYNEKLDDLDAAIKQKAWPVWIFGFGSEEDPWHPDRIDDFMDAEEDEFTPGTKHGVQGDISAETIGGDVPDIQAELNHDIKHIMTALPVPQWAVGEAKDVNKHVSTQQENLLRNQIREARRDLEYRFQNILDKKAEELGYDPDSIKLHIEDPHAEEPNPYEERGSVIHYKSDVQMERERRQMQEEGQEGEGQAGNQTAGSSEGDGESESGSSENNTSELEATPSPRSEGEVGVNAD